jgi:hypothetical protein
MGSLAVSEDIITVLDDIVLFVSLAISSGMYGPARPNGIGKFAFTRWYQM